MRKYLLACLGVLILTRRALTPRRALIVALVMLSMAAASQARSVQDNLAHVTIPTGSSHDVSVLDVQALVARVGQDERDLQRHEVWLQQLEACLSNPAYTRVLIPQCEADWAAAFRVRRACKCDVQLMPMLGPKRHAVRLPRHPLPTP